MAKKKDTRGPRERAYDEHMAPLVKQLIALAKAHKIPLIVNAELDPNDGDANDPMHCSTCVYGDDWPMGARQARISAAQQPERAISFGMVIRRG